MQPNVVRELAWRVAGAITHVSQREELPGALCEKTTRRESSQTDVVAPRSRGECDRVAVRQRVPVTDRKAQSSPKCQDLYHKHMTHIAQVAVRMPSTVPLDRTTATGSRLSVTRLRRKTKPAGRRGDIDKSVTPSAQTKRGNLGR